MNTTYCKTDDGKPCWQLFNQFIGMNGYIFVCGSFADESGRCQPLNETKNGIERCFQCINHEDVSRLTDFIQV